MNVVDLAGSYGREKDLGVALLNALFKSRAYPLDGAVDASILSTRKSRKREISYD
jgi:hypothetical protein